MNEVGVFVKFLLNVVGLFCKDREGTIKILERIFWRLQKGLTVSIAAKFAGRRKNSGINQIRKDCVEIVGELVVITDISANVIQPQLTANLL